MTPACAYEFPPYEGLSLKIEGQVSESYSNNVTYATDEDQRVEDFTTDLSVGAGLRYESARRSAEITGNMSRQFLTKSWDLQNSSERARASFQNEFTEYDRIRVTNSFIHTEVPGILDAELDAAQCQRLEDLFGRDVIRQAYPECDRYEEEFGRFTGRFDSYSNTATFDYFRDFGQYFKVSSGYSYRKRWSDEEGTSDSDWNSFRLRSNYGVSARTMFSLSYVFENNSYENTSDVDIQRVAAGVRRYLTERFYVEALGGVDFTTSENDSENNGRIEVTLAGDINPRTSTTITYLKEDEFASSTEDIFRSWRATGILTSKLIEDLFFNLSGFYGEGEFVSIAVTDTLIGASINLSYIFWQNKYGSRVNGRVGYSYSDLQSTDESRDYSRSGVTAGLTVGF